MADSRRRQVKRQNRMSSESGNKKRKLTSSNRSTLEISDSDEDIIDKEKNRNGNIKDFYNDDDREKSDDADNEDGEGDNDDREKSDDADNEDDEEDYDDREKSDDADNEDDEEDNDDREKSDDADNEDDEEDNDDREKSDDDDNEDDEEDNDDREKSDDADNVDDDEDNDDEKSDDSDKLLKRYILWHAMRAGRKPLKKYPAENESKSKLDSVLHDLMDICESRAWDPDFRKDIKRYPVYEFEKRPKEEANMFKRKRSSRNTGPPECGNCQVCIRPWSYIVTLEGAPYHRDSYREKINKNGTSNVHSGPVEYYMGSACFKRTLLFHDICHFGFHLYRQCKKLIKRMGENKVKEVANDKDLFIKMSSKLKRLEQDTRKLKAKNMYSWRHPIYPWRHSIFGLSSTETL
ncbi:protein starmaker-like [Ruditapes philippinarum]|uniref:protein starmaker-like n=1 Tax=Ruditapes philippinarum TaxID=129788 RepID=UPI00295A6A3E|nr:protein starmaker-like [Ruditapes philippinarum]